MRFFYFVFLLAACAGCATQDSAAGSTSDALADMASDGALADVGPGDVEILEDALAQDVEIPEVSFDVNLDWSWSPSDSFGGQDSQDVEEPKVDLEPLREAFFALENAHLVEITLSAGGVMALDEEPYEYVKGDVHVDGEPFPGIGVRLKGKYGSFRTLDEKAAFLLNFAKYDKDSRLLGMKKLALNNLVQDPSGMHEWLAYTLFRAAEVPASRLGYTWVRVNDEDYGFYAAVEVVDNPHFLKAFFADNDGQLYEGEYGTDLFGGSIKDFDQDGGIEDGKIALYELAAALDEIEAAPEEALAALGEVIDMDQYLAFAATEIWIGHWDGYAWTRNNYFIYRPEADELRWTWMPWGLDQTFRDHLEPFGGEGRVTQLCNLHDGCRAQLAQHFFDVTERVIDLDLLGLADAVETQIWAAMTADPRTEHDIGTMGWVIDETRDFIQDRPGSIEEGLACLDPASVDWDEDGASGCGEDCNDDDPNVYPGAPELCNFQDDDCDGEVDEGGDCPTCMPETFGGVDYALCFNPEQWEDARSACLADGGDLASIHDEETNDFLWGTASAIEYTRWWFGLSDLEEDGVFVWSDGTDLDYFDWGGGEPNGGTNENCVHWADWNDGLWNDIPCDHLMPYVCQF